jgi:hypothetical protein
MRYLCLLALIGCTNEVSGPVQYVPKTITDTVTKGVPTPFPAAPPNGLFYGTASWTYTVANLAGTGVICSGATTLSLTVNSDSSITGSEDILQYNCTIENYADTLFYLTYPVTGKVWATDSIVLYLQGPIVDSGTVNMFSMQGRSNGVLSFPWGRPNVSGGQWMAIRRGSH